MALLPLLAALVLAGWQGVLAGEAWWLAGGAARAAARAQLVGSDARTAARRMLPGRFARGLDVQVVNGVQVVVRVAIPGVLSGPRSIGWVTARAGVPTGVEPR